MRANLFRPALRRAPACALAILAVLAASPRSGAAGRSPATAAETLSSAPAWFEPNTGRLPAQVAFSSQGGSGTLQVERTGATFRAATGSLELRFVGANPGATCEGVGPDGASSSYLVGKNPGLWRRGVAHYRSVLTRQLYPGIDVSWYLSGKELEYDLIVAPGADPSRIRVKFARRPRIEGGDLLFANGLRQKRPAAWQQRGTERVAVAASYRIDRSGEVSLELGTYDRTLPLVIDPVLYSGFIGGDRSETATAMAIDAGGNVWVTGSSASTVSTEGQATPPVQGDNKGGKDVFLAKFIPDGSGQLKLSYWTLLGGSADDEAEAIKIDKLGRIYLVGQTASTDFPLAGTALQPEAGGGIEAFVTEIRPSQTGADALWFSQIYGGNNTDVAYTVDVDSAGAIYFGGYSRSDSLPGAGGGSLQCCNRGGFEGFFAKVLPDSSAPLAYGTYIGGGSTDVINSMVADDNSVVYLAGYTASDDFPYTEGATRTNKGSNVDAFLLKVDLRLPGLDALVYGIYFGGGKLDVAQSLAFDGRGGLWMAGYTMSEDFPVTPGAYRTQSAGAADLFLTRFNLARLGTPDEISYSTYIGGDDNDILYGMTLLRDGSVALAGYTYSGDFPLAAGTAQGADAFVTVFDASRQGSAAVTLSNVFRGALNDAATGLAEDAQGRIFVCGFTNSRDFPVTDGSAKASAGGLTQSLLATVRP